MYSSNTIKESDRERTVFSVNGGKYEFIRMTFEFKNALPVFQRSYFIDR